MKHEKKRITKIVDEIMTYLYSIGAKDIGIRVKEFEDRYVMTFNSDYKKMCEKKLDALIKALKSCSKQQEMEEYYWELLGDCDVDSELTLVGMMVNEAELDVEEDAIELKLTRYKESS